MKLSKMLLGVAAGVALMASPALSADAVKIGMVTTLSTGAGYLGQDVRDGFMLAVEEEGGKLGGVPVEVLVEDDGRKPGTGKQLAERFMKRDGAEILTGIIFSNVAGAVVPSVLREDKIYVSPNAGPSLFAGKKCNQNYFVASWQNDTLHEAAGAYAKQLGYKKAFILAPNYPAGRDALAGFKREFGGEIVGEVYTKLGQADYSAELAQIRDAKPEMVFDFLPGGMGINFLKQYDQGGFKDTTPLVVAAPSMDAKIMAAVGDAAVGVRSASHWNHDLDNAANKKFLAGFNAKYNRVPTVYASQGYDTAKLIASALKAVNGDVSDKEGLRKALKKADFESVRGKFKFAQNNHPINDWYSRIVEKQADGTLVNKTVGVVLKDHMDVYAKDCSM
ncbi:ABC transporter substrate-binding protein [Aestuariispira ectoiniformans]|uniref:ABC transporter substrate-binding protein n=1 Tax=Aestuariispira ectoiniformans TaxID=2775080 RepID=UPI00223BCD6D|nr:ABC transporter substrate-binding protein [Aestuariispira ectoiniformans]